MAGVTAVGGEGEGENSEVGGDGIGIGEKGGNGKEVGGWPALGGSTSRAE